MWSLPILPVDTVASRFGALPSGLPAPHWPQVTPARLIEMLPSAFIIAFLAGVESLLSAIVADRMFGGRHRPSAELLAQGYANIVAPLRSEEHTSELQSLMRISYAVFCLNKKIKKHIII